jgi:hypothetical protein
MRPRDNGGKEDVAVQRAGLLQRHAMGVLEVLDRERAAEREDHRVERHAQTDDVPERSVEPPQITPDEPIRWRGLRHIVVTGDAPIHQVIDDARGDRDK